MKRQWLLAMLAAGLVTVGARAEVWGFVDGKGVAHFAAEKKDDRYELFYRGNESPDPVAESTPRPVAVPAAPPKLVAFFEGSPSYKQVKHHLREASKQHGIDYELLKAVIATESGFDPQAVSPKGAVGLMQVMPATAMRYGVAPDPQTPVEKKLTDPRTNIRTGARYLRYLLDLFPGRLELALAAYNAGEGAVQRAGNKIPNYKETQNYVKTVMQLYGVLKPPAMVAEPARVPGRVRVQMSGPPGTQAEADGLQPPVGGALNRGNMPYQPYVPSRPSQPSQASRPSQASQPLSSLYSPTPPEVRE